MNYIYNLVFTSRRINIMQSEFELNEYIEYLIIGQRLYRVFKSRITKTCFAWRFLPIELNCELYIYIHNLVLTRQGINIIQSELHLNEYIGYFILGHSIYRILRSGITTFVSRGDSFLLNSIAQYIYI
jgi:hypothetical protein